MPHPRADITTKHLFDLKCSPTMALLDLSTLHMRSQEAGGGSRGQSVDSCWWPSLRIGLAYRP